MHGLSRFRGLARPAVSLVSLIVLCGALVAAPTGRAADPTPPNQLWKEFPLNEQGTRSNPSQPPPPATVRAPLQPPPRQAPPAADTGGGISNGTKTAIVVALAAALAAVLIVAAALWPPLRTRRRRLAAQLGSAPARWRAMLAGLKRRLPAGRTIAGGAFARRRDARKTRRAPALAFASATSSPDASRGNVRESPTMRLAARLAWWRRAKADALPEPRLAHDGEAGVEGGPDEHSDLIVGRLVHYSLRPGDGALHSGDDAKPEPAQEQAAVQSELPVEPATLTADPFAARLGIELERARDGHYALSLAALYVGQGDLEPFEVREAGETTARVILGDSSDIDLLVSDDGTLWVILPGVLPKRARAVAQHLHDLLAPGESSPTIAVVGYPRDGTTVKRLVERCRETLSGEPPSDGAPAS